MREVENEFEAAGITVRFVVIGTPEEAARFAAQFGDASRVLADPEKKTYKSMGLGDFNLLHLFTNRDLTRRRRENRAAGFRQNWRATKLANAAQLPGAAVLDRDGSVRWVYRGTHPGDLPTMREMLDQARRALH